LLIPGTFENLIFKRLDDICFGKNPMANILVHYVGINITKKISDDMYEIFSGFEIEKVD
jgi:hypothetical protein